MDQFTGSGNSLSESELGAKSQVEYSITEVNRHENDVTFTEHFTANESNQSLTEGNTMQSTDKTYQHENSSSSSSSNEELTNLLQRYHSKFNRNVATLSTVSDRKFGAGSPIPESQTSLRFTDHRMSSENRSEAVGMCEENLNQNDSSEEQSLDQLYASRSGSSGGCESESRVKLEMGESNELNYHQNGNTSSAQHYATEFSKDISINSPFLPSIKQEHPSEQSISSQEDSSGELSDGEEFTDLLQRCYGEPNSNVTAQHTAKNRRVNSKVKVKELRRTNKQSDDSAECNSCPVCLKVFNELRHLKRHIQRKHSSDRQYQCSQCEKSYCIKSELTQHVKHVHGDTRYYCDMCGFSTNYSQQLKIHISAVHLERNGQKCPHCDSCFSHRKSLMRHIRSVHSQDKSRTDSYSDRCREKRFACNLCDYRCAQKGHLTRHRTAAHARKFSCTICDFITSAKSNLDQHLVDVHGSLAADNEEAATASNYTGMPTESKHCTSVLPYEVRSICPTEEDLIDESSLAEKSLSGECESESRVKDEVEDCADSYGKIPAHHFSSDDFSEILNEQNSINAIIKQECLSEQSNSSFVDSSRSDGEEFSDLFQRCYPKSSSHVTTQPCDIDREVTAEDSQATTPDLTDTDSRTLNEEASVAPLIHSTVPGDQCSAEPVDGGPNDSLGMDGVDGATEQDDGMYISCLLCKQSFASVSDLTQHIQHVHLSDKQHQCTTCEKSFSMKSELTKHVKRVHGDKIYACDQCEYSTAVSYRLKSHMNAVHAEDKSHKCQLCEKSFGSNSELTKHMKRVHGDRIFNCDQCEYSCRDSYRLKSHVSAVHLDEKIHQCPECDSAFSNKGHLTQHVKAVHNQEKPFECSVCFKRFSRRQYRDVHWRSVHCGEKPYSCDQCGAKFSHKGNLTQHERGVHDREKQISCSVAFQDFNQDLNQDVNEESP